MVHPEISQGLFSVHLQQMELKSINPKSNNQKMSKYLEDDKEQSSIQLFEKMKGYEFMPVINTWNNLFRLTKNGKYEEVKDVLRSN